MASVNERIFRLEAKVAPPHEVSPAMDQLLDAIEDARREIRREIAGLPPCNASLQHEPRGAKRLSGRGHNQGHFD